MDYLPLFPSPVLVVRIEGMDALNVRLARRFELESREGVGIHRSNVGGWHSVPDLSTRQDPVLQELISMLADATLAGMAELGRRSGANVWPEYRLGLQAWAMVMRDGHYTIPHDHAEAHISGVYYLDAGDANTDLHPDSGLLAFLDPRGGLPHIPGLEIYPSTFTVQPQTGVLVLFPGFLTHYVHPYRGTRARVSVSFNVRAEPVPPLPAEK